MYMPFTLLCRLIDFPQSNKDGPSLTGHYYTLHNLIWYRRMEYIMLISS